MPRALVTGCTGQVGSYMCDYLLDKGYKVAGMVAHRNQPYPDYTQAALENENFRIVHGDLLDAQSLDYIVADVLPDEVYNFAAQSFVHRSWELPVYTGDVTGLGALRLFESVRRFYPQARVYQASSSEMFGKSPPAQDELSAFRPESPYAVAKLLAHHAAVAYRDAYGLFIACGIMFNAESPRRGEHFVVQKVAKAVAMIEAGLETELRIGNTHARRDWGWAPDYVDAAWRSLQYESPETFVIGSGRQHSVQYLLDCAFAEIGKDSREYVVVDQSLIRPVDSLNLLANVSKAYRLLGWEPKTEFSTVLHCMIEAWRKKISDGRLSGCKHDGEIHFRDENPDAPKAAVAAGRGCGHCSG